MQIVPLSQSEVEVVVATFRVLVDEIRRNVPDVLLATMTILFTNYKAVKASATQWDIFWNLAGLYFVTEVALT